MQDDLDIFTETISGKRVQFLDSFEGFSAFASRYESFVLSDVKPPPSTNYCQHVFKRNTNGAEILCFCCFFVFLLEYLGKILMLLGYLPISI